MSTERVPTPTRPLASAIATGIALLGDLRRPAPEVTSGRLAQHLQTALDQHARIPGPSTGPGTSPSAGPGATAVAAVRTACAHLRTGALDDAYLALLTARDNLPAPTSDHH